MNITEIMKLIDAYANAKVTENSGSSLAVFFSSSAKKREIIIDALLKMQRETSV